MSEFIGIPIMKWQNRAVITKRLRDLLLDKIHDDLLTKEETLDVITTWLKELEETPYYVLIMLPLLSYILNTLNIDWNAHMDDKRVEVIANIIVAMLMSWGGR